MKRGRKRPTSFRAIALRVCALALALWLCSMALLTWAVASDMYLQLDHLALEQVSGHSGRDFQQNELEDLPGRMEANTIRRLGLPQVGLALRMERLLPFVLPNPSSISSDDWLWGKWDLVHGYEAAEVIYNGAPQTQLQSGNYLSFAYTTKEKWESQNTQPLGYAYVELDAIQGAAKAFQGFLSEYPLDFNTDYFLPVLRLTGYFEGNAFHPTTVDRGMYFAFDVDVQLLSDMDGQNTLDWESLFIADAPAGHELETIYGWDVTGKGYVPKSLSVNGEDYDSLVQLLCSQGNRTRKTLTDAVILYSCDHEDSYGSYTYALAVRCKPLQYAMLRLWHVYLISAGVVVLWVFLLLRRIRKNLVLPLSGMITSADCGSTVIPAAAWADIYALEQHFAHSRQTQAETNLQLQQLRTALDYAKNAEENRRQLISNITHELKTPLAVIRSYTEALQEGIAGNKTDSYLSVILEETEQMDAVVLQMLDLSRLEAGKVRLAAEPVALAQLVRTTAEKFSLLLEAKGLRLHFLPSEDFLVTADEDRIGQVLTNLISNAVKYTNENGAICLRVYTENAMACFDIMNTADHLTDTALQKVWDSFYRVDPARSEPGTGLGLTLVKSIIELHRGSCYVENTTFRADGRIETGVKFGFKLPLR